MISTAIVGLGWWGRHIVETLSIDNKDGNGSQFNITRAVDIDPDATREFAAERGLDFSQDLGDSLHDDAIEAVILTTPHTFHEKQVVAAANAGKHVFCEKPLALTRASAERAVVACDQAGVVLGLGHERRFEPAMLEIKRLVQSGELGEIMHVEANFSHDKLANLPADNWRVSKEESPAAGMTAMGIHQTDIYLTMFGPVAEIHAQTAVRNPANANGDVLTFQLRFESGATGFFGCVMETPLYMRLCVLGSKAWVEARDYSHPSEDGPTDLFISRAEGKIEKTTYDYIDTVAANFNAWADAITGKAPYPFTNEERIQNIAVFEAICQSVETGLPVKLK